jgi:hypothetical protein
MLIGLGHSLDFEQYTKVFGTLIKAKSAEMLPSAAAFIDGMQPTVKMREKGAKFYPYLGWLGTTAWHANMALGASASERYLGNSSCFQQFIRRALAEPWAKQVAEARCPTR